MLRRFPSFKKPTPLDLQIEAVLKKMQALGVDHENYPKMLNHLERLYELKENDNRKPVSRDTMALVLGNLAGILLIVVYEQRGHVMTSKAFSQVRQPKRPE